MSVWRRIAKTLRDGPATEPAAPIAEDTVRALAAQLDAAAQIRLGRSLCIRHVDTGSCNGCELEIHALNNIVYDLERFGVRFVASPRHADVLLVTGPLTRNLAEALQRTWDATPDPNGSSRSGTARWTAACSREATRSWAGSAPPCRSDLVVGGCPPTPAQLLNGLRALLEANARR